MINIVKDLAILIRDSWKDLPGLEESGDNEFPVIHKETKRDNIYIFNEMYKCDGIRKAHLEICKTGKLDVLHCVWFPDTKYNLPIFGADIIATPTMCTAAIVDVSPVYGTESIHSEINKISNKYFFKEHRVLPLWGEEIFSPQMKFVRLRDDKEMGQFHEVVLQYLKIYTSAIKVAKPDSNWINEMKRLDDQIWYCKSQKKNRKTSNVLSSWFTPQWADHYIDTVLFDEPHADIPSNK